MTNYLALLRNGKSFTEVMATLENDLPFPPPPPRPKHRTIGELYQWVEDNWAILTGPYDDAFEDFYVAREQGLITKKEFE